MYKLKMITSLTCAIALCFGVAWANESHQQNIVASTVLSIDSSTSTHSNETKPHIMLDAGHGGYDSGSIGADGSLEKDITLSITLQIGTILQEEGFTITYTRESDAVSWESDNIRDLHTRVDMATQANADYYISLHTNFSSYNDGAYGFETYLNYENQTIVQMASRIHQELRMMDYTQDRGLKSTTESPLFVIDNNRVPALLLELGFLSDEEDANTLLYHQEELAQAIAYGIINTFS